MPFWFLLKGSLDKNLSDIEKLNGLPVERSYVVKIESAMDFLLTNGMRMRAAEKEVEFIHLKDAFARLINL